MKVSELLKRLLDDDVPGDAEVYIERFGYAQPASVIHVGWYNRTTNAFSVAATDDDRDTNPIDGPNGVLIL
jgi:hypothetical protein